MPSLFSSAIRLRRFQLPVEITRFSAWFGLVDQVSTAGISGFLALSYPEVAKCEERTIEDKPKLMSVLISDEILQAAQISGQELQREIAVLLYQQGKLGLGKARELAGMPLIAFQQELSQRGIAVQDNEVGFLAEVEQLKALGDL